jgi:predicted amidohydrolase
MKKWIYLDNCFYLFYNDLSLYHLRLRVECTLFCKLQSRARTHTVLVMGLHELLGNPTTYLIEPPGPLHLIYKHTTLCDQVCQ